jgi:hypothetical protein
MPPPPPPPPLVPIRGRFDAGRVPDYYAERGWCEEWAGWNKLTVCTQKYLRDLLRQLWENKKHHGENPIVSIHVKNPSGKGSRIHECCRVDGWQTGFEAEYNREIEYFCVTETALCTDGKDHQFWHKFKIEDVIWVMVT